jgi:hypothetical protein
MTDHTRIEIDIREHESNMPGPYYEDPVNPTPEEIADYERQLDEWRAAGGADQHYLRIRMVAGPPEAFKPDVGVADLKQKVIESPLFHKDDDADRIAARAAAFEMIGPSILGYFKP